MAAGTSNGTVAGLRAWARGDYATEAAVELLARAFHGRFASSDWPWIQPTEAAGSFWVDADAIVSESGLLSGGERRLLAVVGALAGGPPVTDLGDTLAGLDRDNQALVLAALAHAGGSHEHRLLRLRAAGPVLEQPGPLLDWPANAPAGYVGLGGRGMTCQHPSRWTVEAACNLVSGAVPSCSGTDPEAWFARNTRQLRTCIRICAGCPVRTSCLAGALARGEEFGVWGGLRFKPAWAEAWVVPRKKGYALVGRDPDGASLKWVLPYCSRSEAEALARKVVYRGRRRAYVARWVRRIGVPVQTPGSWWIGPWTDADPQRRTARMRPLVASMLRDRPVQGWPWELRLLVEFPASAVPKAGKPVPGGRRDLDHDLDHEHDHDRADRHAAHHDHDQHPDGLDGRAARCPLRRNTVGGCAGSRRLSVVRCGGGLPVPAGCCGTIRFVA